MLGGIEAGGTKFVCGIGSGPDDLKTASFPTSDPDVTLRQVIEFFQLNAGKDLEALGIGSFGPVDLDTSSDSYGFITTTPKQGWANFDLAGTVARALNVPVGFDTDVNAALLGEARWGAAQDLAHAIYLTIGTGVGGGAMVQGQVIHGLVHPEIGHLRLPHDWAKDPFPGICPYHGDCLEGLACGPAMQKRWNAPAATLPHDHPAWALEANYLALALVNLTLTLSPQRILLGGGVMQQPQLFAMVRADFARLMNGYVQHPDVLTGLDEFIQPPGLGSRAGVLGVLCWLNLNRPPLCWTTLYVNVRIGEESMSVNATLVKSTIVAALGGLLFGFDTAVIAGTTSDLTRAFALTPARSASLYP